jgi:uncharacterized protein YbjT (DUF2867 family)
MVGQSVLRACLLDPDVTEVVALGRSPSGVQHAKLVDMVRGDLFALGDELNGFDACFWCLGVPSSGKTEREYRRITIDLTMAIAGPLAVRNPKVTFVFISGEGASPTARAMWRRVKGLAEEAVLGLWFRAYVFRPGLVLPTHGERAGSRSYRLMYRMIAPWHGVLRRVLPRNVIHSEEIGRAMLALAKRRSEKRVFENADIARLAAVH